MFYTSLHHTVTFSVKLTISWPVGKSERVTCLAQNDIQLGTIVKRFSLQFIRLTYIYRATLCVVMVFAVGRCESVVSVSVCPSDMFAYCIRKVKYIVKLVSRCGSSIFLFFLTQSADIARETPSAGTTNSRAWEKLMIFD